MLTYRGHLTLTSDKTFFYYTYSRELLRDGVMLRTKTWHEAIARDFQ